MRMSQLFSKTLREVPSYADTPGYALLLRAGYIRQLGAGIFSALPLGFRSLQKISNIIRDEMEKIGGQEIEMPVVNPADIWKETGRYYSVGDELTRFQDRVERDMVLAMTHEEAVTAIAKYEIDSYKNLPKLVYQIQTKWRDDPRPRAGLIRVREFKMKDSYSFDTNEKGLEKQYQAHYDAYFRMFQRCGLPVIVVSSDSGMMGGKLAHEYMYLSPVGEDTIVICDGCGYTANRQVAKFSRGTNKQEMLPLKEVATPGAKTIEEVASYLGITPANTAKVLCMVGTFPASQGESGNSKATGGDDTQGETGDPQETQEKLIVAVVRGDLEVEEAKLQFAVKALDLRPATEEEILAVGMVPGYGSPMGIADVLTVVDFSIKGSNNLVAGANKEGYHIKNSNFGRDYTGQVADIAGAKDGAACSQCGKPMHTSRGVEAGNIFQLGTRYSEALGCYYQDEGGKQKPVYMGSYGIGIGRLLACLAEEHGTEKGLTLPLSVAPYQVHMVPLGKDMSAGEELYAELSAQGLEVLFDDRQVSAGVKFNDADLMGIPLRITMGNRTLQEGTVEAQVGIDGEKELVPLGNVTSWIQAKIAELTPAV